MINLVDEGSATVHLGSKGEGLFLYTGKSIVEKRALNLLNFIDLIMFSSTTLLHMFRLGLKIRSI